MFLKYITNNDKTIINQKLSHLDYFYNNAEDYRNNMLNFWNRGKSKNPLMQELFEEQLIIEIGDIEEKVVIEEYRLSNKLQEVRQAMFYLSTLEFIAHKVVNYKTSMSSDHEKIIQNICIPLNKQEIFTLFNAILKIEQYTREPKHWINNKSNIEDKFKIGGKTFSFHKGQKMGKVLRTIKELYTYCVNDKFNLDIDLFMTEMSQLINKKFTGTLCLSIHPLDYITCSDNEHNWTSCMSIARQAEYCNAVLEAMQSSNVIVAYVKSDTPDSTGWNSKKWRQFIHLDSTILIGNKQYPFSNLAISKKAISYIYDKLQLDNRGFEKIRQLDKTEPVYFYCELMYDDYNSMKWNEKMDDVIASVNTTTKNLIINVTEDEVLCPLCKGEIAYNDNSNVLACSSCVPRYWCDCCEDYHFEETIELSGYGMICHKCYYEYFNTCSHLEGRTLAELGEAYYSYYEDRIMCEDCYYKTHVSCNSCGLWMYNEAVTLRGEEGQAYCSNFCRQRDKGSVVDQMLSKLITWLDSERDLINHKSDTTTEKFKKRTSMEIK